MLALAIAGPQSFEPSQDPGVVAVRRMYAYFRKHGHNTICMPASWRSSTGANPCSTVPCHGMNMYAIAATAHGAYCTPIGVPSAVRRHLSDVLCGLASLRPRSSTPYLGSLSYCALYDVFKLRF